MCMRCSFYCPKDAIKIGFLNGWKVNGKYNFDIIKKNELKQYITNDNVHYFDNNGQSSDEYMEYQINHLGLESIIKNVIRT